jgi:hypothetical protein
MINTGSSREDSISSTETGTDYFLELWGETNPQVSVDYGVVYKSKGDQPNAPVYEYFWTLGTIETLLSDELSGQQEDSEDQQSSNNHGKRFPHWTFRHQTPDNTHLAWGRLPLDARAEVYLLFPRENKWRVHEIAASVKYLSPAPRDLAQEVEKDLTAFQPILSLAGTAASAIGAVGGGPIAAATGRALNTMAKMRLGSVPQTRQFSWSVTKLTTRVSPDTNGASEDPSREILSGEVMDGVVWSLPTSMLKELGNRVTGSAAVVLIPATDSSPSQALDIGTLKAFAVLPQSKDKGQRVPGAEGKMVTLTVHPHM